MVEPGTYLEFSYPINRHVRLFEVVPRRLRKIEVKRVRDLVREPLTINEFARRPYVMRSRWLIAGIDLDVGQWRQFYLGSSDEFRAPGNLRIALYRPGDTCPTEILGREFLPTVFDRRVMLRLIRRWNDRDLGQMDLRIVCDNFRIVK
ncbi:hypothetical protein K227x_63900 [Rubripirellula lacrimiformis]|uniref:Uncharacterized protein n=1 Tax=Rubripirellula lacrimiformis TaxID=1930273 RepID=A0A517NLF4_9BACT|nr:hypothetical protein [Rubripirellula lacrimiformis]QDT07960.1 hypothetical protein K227x_63900 [Rubripirellula lacrimiformis]